MRIGPIQLDGSNLFLIAGPCVLENADVPRRIAEAVKAACSELKIPYIFKASFDKANRTSARSFRGPGMEEGLKELSAIGSEFGVPTLTDVHLPEHCEPAAQAVDVLQIPAFLCRQTDLLEAAATAAARHGKAVNVKKG
jgi:2-dehydro-3-deoxyphosphooctonate aldolase (KDO 8-P synthase)